jgi:ferredoxin
MSHELRVEIDQTICMGVGDCERVAPTAFRLDDDGLSVLLDPSSVTEETLRAVAAACPSGAIQIVE